MENSKKSRRKFLDKGIKLGLATAIGGIAISKFTSKASARNAKASGETMELMTTDGHLIQVDSTEVMEHEAMNHKPDYNIREGIPNRKFVMVVDLAKCENH